MTVQTATTIEIPKSDQCCRISIINTTCEITVPPNYLVEPDVAGWEWINLPTFSFYIKHERSGRELLFDLGARKDWENHVPSIKGLIEGHVPGFRVTKDVVDILPDGNVDANNIEALILSHFHFDHSGAPSKLASSTRAVVGPGFKDAFLPGWPAREDSTFHEDDFGNREVFEVPFTDEFKIGQFQAYDYFGDGSLYLLHTPGHAVAHISGLVIFGLHNICPSQIQFQRRRYLTKRYQDLARARHSFRLIQKGANGKDQPFFRPSSGPNTFYSDPPTSWDSSHDPTSLEVFDFFPNTINDWKEKGWKAAAHWGFLSEIPYNGKCVRAKLVDGLYKDGEKIRGMELS